MDPLAALSKEELIALVRAQATALQQAQQEIAALKQEIARLRSGGSNGTPPRSVPEWVHPNTPAAAKQPRKRRTHHPTFHRLPPTRTLAHACDTCPDC